MLVIESYLLFLTSQHNNAYYMNKQSLRFSAFVALIFVVLFSCKKTNSLNPYPSNVRLANYTKSIKRTTYPTVPIYTENYRFVYNQVNQIAQIYFTTNDPAGGNYIAHLEYVGTRIYDTITSVSGSFIELDSFITDLKGNITTTYIGASKTGYSYDGNLLTRIDYGSSYSIFTSYNGNFIKAVSSLGDGYDEDYTYYTDQFNRIGDYFWLQSVSRYGLNLYKYSSLVRSYGSPTDSSQYSYTIDAYNKITQVVAINNDTFSHNMIGTTVVHPYSDTEIYNLQYETY